jgi:hypothetical protein
MGKMESRVGKMVERMVERMESMESMERMGKTVVEQTQKT